MNQQDCISTAIDITSAWNIQDEDLADAINDRARLMAGFNPDDIQDNFVDTH